MSNLVWLIFYFGSSVQMGNTYYPGRDFKATSISCFVSRRIPIPEEQGRVIYVLSVNGGTIALNDPNGFPFSSVSMPGKTVFPKGKPITLLAASPTRKGGEAVCVLMGGE